MARAILTPTRSIGLVVLGAVVLAGYAFVRPEDAGASSWQGFAGGVLRLLYAALIIVALVKSLYFGFKRHSSAAWQYIAALCIGYFVLVLLSLGWRPGFSYRPDPHETIAKIYQQRRAEEF